MYFLNFVCTSEYKSLVDFVIFGVCSVVHWCTKLPWFRGGVLLQPLSVLAPSCTPHACIVCYANFASFNVQVSPRSFVLRCCWPLFDLPAQFGFGGHSLIRLVRER